jgi:predicted transcriptional regulator
METVPISPERKKQLDDYARRHGQDAATALDEVLGEWLAEERKDFEESVEAIRRGFEDVRAGRTRPAVEFFADVRRKYGFPG